MSILVLGLVLFFAVHLVPAAPALRGGLIARVGENGYKLAYSLLSVAGLVLVVIGWGRAPYEPVYAAPAWGRPLAMLLVPVAVVLLAAANMPGHIRYRLKHPMLIGVLLWAGAHLAANGDLRALVLFGSFAAYALVDMLSEIARGKTLIGSKPPRSGMDAAAIVGGLAVAALLAYFHGALFGVPLHAR